MLMGTMRDREPCQRLETNNGHRAVQPFSDYEIKIMMRRILSSALLTTMVAWSLPAYAGGLTRTFVSSTGSDTSPCTTYHAAPCATFAAAYAAELHRMGS